MHRINFGQKLNAVNSISNDALPNYDCIIYSSVRSADEVILAFSKFLWYQKKLCCYPAYLLKLHHSWEAWGFVS